jgi:hypothetical protein
MLTCFFVLVTKDDFRLEISGRRKKERKKKLSSEAAYCFGIEHVS